MTLNTSRRNVIVTSGPDKYLVSLAVTTDATQAVAEAPSTDGIINGFRVGPPGCIPPAAPPAAARRAARARSAAGGSRSATGAGALVAGRCGGPAQPRIVAPCS